MGKKFELEKETSLQFGFGKRGIVGFSQDIDVDDWLVAPLLKAIKAKLKGILLFLLFLEKNPKHKVKHNLGFIEPILAMISPPILTLIGLHVLAYGFHFLILYYAFLTVTLLEIFHIVFDR